MERCRLMDGNGQQPPIVFMSASVAWSVFSRIQQSDHVRLNAPSLSICVTKKDTRNNGCLFSALMQISDDAVWLRDV